MIKSIDGAYYTSAYFWVTTALIIIGMGAYWWRNWDRWERRDAKRDGWWTPPKKGEGSFPPLTRENFPGKKE